MKKDNFSEKDRLFMQKALALAKEAGEDGEVPVGAVVVHNGKVIGSGKNRREKIKNALAHAELEAINEACNTLGGWRLPECTLYVTLEPCPMCAGGIINARIGRTVIALRDAKSGCLGSVINFNSYPFNHKTVTEYGLCESEARSLMSDFFISLREKRSLKNKL